MSAFRQAVLTVPAPGALERRTTGNKGRLELCHKGIGLWLADLAAGEPAE